MSGETLRQRLAQMGTAPSVVEILTADWPGTFLWREADLLAQRDHFQREASIFRSQRDEARAELEYIKDQLRRRGWLV